MKAPTQLLEAFRDAWPVGVPVPDDIERRLTRLAGRGLTVADIRYAARDTFSRDIDRPQAWFVSLLRRRVEHRQAREDESAEMSEATRLQVDAVWHLVDERWASPLPWKFARAVHRLVTAGLGVDDFAWAIDRVRERQSVERVHDPKRLLMTLLTVRLHELRAGERTEVAA
jgi:hypothetical protein